MLIEDILISQGVEPGTTEFSDYLYIYLQEILTGNMTSYSKMIEATGDGQCMAEPIPIADEPHDETDSFWRSVDAQREYGLRRDSLDIRDEAHFDEEKQTRLDVQTSPVHLTAEVLEKHRIKEGGKKGDTKYNSGSKRRIAEMFARHKDDYAKLADEMAEKDKGSGDDSDLDSTVSSPISR